MENWDFMVFEIRNAPMASTHISVSSGLWANGMVGSYSWSTVKVDRNGLQFFWKHVLKRDWQWVKMIRARKIRSLPDILTVAEVERLIGATPKLRYRVFLLRRIRWDCA